MNLPKGNQYGLIAQDVELILPSLTSHAFQAYDEAASNTPEGQGYEFKVLNYIRIIPILVTGMQAQQGVIESQTQQIIKLQKQEDIGSQTIVQTNIAVF